MSQQRRKGESSESVTKRASGTGILTSSSRFGSIAKVADAEKPDYQPSFRSVLEPPTSSSYSDDFSYTDHSLSMYEPAQFNSSFSESAPSGFEDLSLQVPALHMEDETPKRKPIMYEELRNKNRENFEVKMTQKAEVLLKPQQDRAPKTEVKKNMYGDTWN